MTARDKLIATQELHAYLPGTTLFSSESLSWKNVSIYAYAFPNRLETKPPVMLREFSLSLLNCGHVRGEFSVDRGPWTKQYRRPQEFVLLPGNQSLNWRWWPINQHCDRVVSTFVHLEPDFIKRVAAETLDIEPNCIEMLNRFALKDPLLYQLVLTLCGEITGDSSGGSTYAETVNQLMAVHLLRHYCTRKPRVPTYQGGLPRWKLNRVIDYIEAHLGSDISLEALASLADLSPYHFAHAFKQSLHISPHQYVMQCRIEAAKNLLSHSRNSVTDIALATGHSSLAHLSANFKRHAGVTPSVYRHTVRGNTQTQESVNNNKNL